MFKERDSPRPPRGLIVFFLVAAVGLVLFVS
jgi:hypothetical protein